MDLANRIKAEWAANFFKGKRGDLMVVARREGRVVGFLQCLKSPDGTLVIDLFATDPNVRREGIATDMIVFGAEQTGNRGVSIGTQIANTPSINLFEGMGFRIVSAQYVFHFHK